ncbi:MAG: hypothetical protein PHO63_05285 [Bacilli bacterium]|nr:hypothetical protein [Bacilli bacterium]MDD4808509.1 hypothetical protein [Bacilli bacterium]
MKDLDNDKIKDSTNDIQEIDPGCYFTTACMRHMQDSFNNNCEELRALNWFTDNFITKEEMEQYYQIAPLVVKAIENDSNRDVTYAYICENIINPCFVDIKTGDYENAYKRYKSCVMAFNEVYARKELQKKLVKVLRKVR